MDLTCTKSAAELLESIYQEYHHPSFIHPDPLEFLNNYPETKDREIAGIIASSLATGRVNLILKAVETVLEKLPSPHDMLMNMTESDIKNLFRNFKYRFYNSDSLIDFLTGIKISIQEYGSLNELFSFALKKSDNEIQEALFTFADTINGKSFSGYRLLPDPSKGSACKRLNLYLRWMVRKDTVDPGGWEDIPRSILIVPLDTHMMKISSILNFVTRKSADMKSAIEITEHLKTFDREDPVRYDFSLTRLGIHPDLNYDRLYQKFV